MSDFLWSAGHLGWGVFVLVVFTGLWWLLGDLYWRLQSIRVGRLLLALAAGWALGAALVVMGFRIAG
jgi:hypothetical protein